MFVKKLFTIVCLLSGIVAKTQTGTTLSLLPSPGNIELKMGSFRLTENFTVAIHEADTDTILVNAVNRMYQTLNRRSGLYFKQKNIKRCEENCPKYCAIH